MPELTSMLMNKNTESGRMNMNERQIYQEHASFKHPASPSLPSSIPPPFPRRPVIFYSLTRGEFNKYMQMCAVEHDECKSGEDVL